MVVRSGGVVVRSGEVVVLTIKGTDVELPSYSC